jgi:hypothetical protein
MATIPVDPSSRQAAFALRANWLSFGRSLLAAIRRIRRIRPATLKVAQLELILRPDRPLRLDGLGGRTIRCTSGCVWITAPGVADDIFLRLGESWQVPHRGRVLVEAVGHAEIALTD